MVISDVSTSALDAEPPWYNELPIDQVFLKTSTISSKNSLLQNLLVQLTSWKGAASISRTNQITGYEIELAAGNKILVRHQNKKTKGKKKQIIWEITVTIPILNIILKINQNGHMIICTVLITAAWCLHRYHCSWTDIFNYFRTHVP